MALGHSTPTPGPADPDAVYEREVERRLAKKHRLLDDVDDLVEQLEAIDWRAVPTFSTAEVAALTARLIEAREAVEERGLDG